MTDDPMIAIRASFFEECEELVESLHDALQLMEQGSGLHAIGRVDGRLVSGIDPRREGAALGR